MTAPGVDRLVDAGCAPSARLDGLVAANPVAVGVVAVTAVRSTANSGRANSGRADRCRTDTVAPIPVAATPISIAPIACAAHCDSAAAPRSSNCDRAAAVAAAPIGTSAAPSLGIIWDQAGGEQNDSGKRSENIAEHDRNLSTNSPSPAREIAALSAREVDVDQRELMGAPAPVRPLPRGKKAKPRPIKLALARWRGNSECSRTSSGLINRVAPSNWQPAIFTTAFAWQAVSVRLATLCGAAIWMLFQFLAS